GSFKRLVFLLERFPLERLVVELRVELDVAEVILADQLASRSSDDGTDLKPGLLVDVEGRLDDSVVFWFHVLASLEHPASSAVALFYFFLANQFHVQSVLGFGGFPTG